MTTSQNRDTMSKPGRKGSCLQMPTSDDSVASRWWISPAVVRRQGL